MPGNLKWNQIEVFSSWDNDVFKTTIMTFVNNRLITTCAILEDRLTSSLCLSLHMNVCER